ADAGRLGRALARQRGGHSPGKGIEAHGVYAGAAVQHRIAGDVLVDHVVAGATRQGVWAALSGYDVGEVVAREDVAERGARDVLDADQGVHALARVLGDALDAEVDGDAGRRAGEVARAV